MMKYGHAWLFVEQPAREQSETIPPTEHLLVQ